MSSGQDTTASVPQKRPEWLAWALGSGAFAATNGVFAKLTTADKTHHIASSVSHLFGLSDTNTFLEIVLRAIFFGLNLLSNAIMWILFTRALTAATSTTRVSILNVSANFMVTAILGMLIFGEGLPLGWWLGASLLVAGSVVIGAREGGADNKDAQANAGSDDVGLQDADIIANGLGVGGIEQDVLANRRFRDDPDEASNHESFSDEQETPVKSGQ